jgi:hypothetical protein
VVWNASDKEYGVLFVKGSPSKLYFARVDRLGALLFGPAELTGASMPPVFGGYQSPMLAYVASSDTWAVVYHREGPDQAYVTLFDDSATELATRELEDGSDSEFQSVVYHPQVDMIVTSNDTGGSVWDTTVHGFNNALGTPAQMVLNATQGSAFPYNGAFGSIVAMPGLNGAPPSAMVAFHYRASTNPPLFHGMIQSVDLAGKGVKWPKGGASIAGKTFAHDVKHSPFPLMAWSPEAQVIGLTYIRDIDGAWDAENDAFFVIIDPSTGSPLMAPAHLNAAAPAKAHQMFVQVAWDGEEFLVSWNDARDVQADRRVRMTKFNGAGAQLGSGDFLYPHAGNLVATTSVGRGVTGHDRIHTLAYAHRSSNADNTDVWLCIEPEYQ